MSSIDLNSPPPGHEFSVSVERVKTNDERYVRLFKDVVLFVTALVFCIADCVAMFPYSGFGRFVAGCKEVGAVSAFRCGGRADWVSE